MRKINKFLAIIMITVIISGCTSGNPDNSTDSSNSDSSNILHNLKVKLFKDNNLSAKIVSSKNFSYPRKGWEIEFNSSINKDSVSNENVYIQKSNGTKIDTTIEYSNEDKNLTIKPEENYIKWEKYTLVVDQGIESTDEEKKILEEKLEYEFDMNKLLYKACTIENFEEFKPTGTVKTNEEFYNEVKYALDTCKESIELTIKNTEDVDISTSDVINAIDDNLPLLVYLSGTEEKNKSTDNKKIIRITFKYIEKPEKVKKLRKKVQEESDRILSKIIKPNMKDWEKEKAIHDYLCSTTTYEMSYSSTLLATAYGALINQKAQCQGTAHAAYLLMNKAGIPCTCISGSAGGSHIWNLVNLKGNFYHVDCTWDNTENLEGDKLISYKHFNIDDDTIRGTHEWKLENYPLADSTEYSTKKLGIVDKEMERKIKTAQLVKNEKEFKEKIEKSIKKKKENIVLKVEKYNRDKYSVSSAMNDIKVDCSLSYKYDDTANLRENQEEYIEILFTY